MEICDQRQGSLSENDRPELAKLLIKAGYQVTVDRKRPMGKTRVNGYGLLNLTEKHKAVTQCQIELLRNPFA